MAMFRPRTRSRDWGGHRARWLSSSQDDFFFITGSPVWATSASPKRLSVAKYITSSSLSEFV